MFRNSIPQSDEPTDPIIYITYKFTKGKSWEECGVSKVDGYLTLSGFLPLRRLLNFAIL